MRKMTPQQLKNSILQMAMQGKLVEQRPEEGTGEALYQEIQAEKKKLIKAGKIKKSKKLPEITEEEIPFEIPESWKWVRLGEILNTLNDGAHKTPRYTPNGVPFISVKNMSSGKLKFENCKFVSKEEHEILRKRCHPEFGDILLSKVGTTGVPTIVDTEREFDLFVSVALLKFDKLLIDNQFLTYEIQSPLVQEQAKENTRGVGNKNWVIRDISKTIIVLPPLPEQNRIVAKLEEIQPLLDRYEKAYNRLEAYNQKFPENLKKSILQYAIEGKLVEQRPEEGTGEALYQEIQAEKKKLIQAGKIKKSKKLPEITEEEIPFEIPESWKWVYYSDICTIINGDRGKNYPAKSTLTHSGIPFISAVNINGETVVEDDKLLCLSDEQYERLNSGKLRKDDIIVCIRGSLGKHGRYPFEKGAIASSLVICRLFIFNTVMIKYMMLFLDSPLFFDQIKKYDNGTAQPNLSAKSLHQFLIPLPPLEEQKRIVAKIEELMAMVEKCKEAEN
ncbi:restriction endonuclease subunit S [Pseudoramibacter porci]|nr:restriction endonuclease subunit S [Pseudoramibacter porci]